MKLFACQNCGAQVYFENRFCEFCQFRLGYLPQKRILTALSPAGDQWRAMATRGRRVRFCANAAFDACNWLVAAESQDDFCAACRHNRMIPDLSADDHLNRWRSMEFAKHRLFYTLIKLDLPLANRVDDPAHGLVFDFLATAPDGAGPKIMTGHEDGLITLNLDEADDGTRERLRTVMGEPYRTLLGHFRHEVGHYYWDVLVRDGGHVQACRAMFGDDTLDYATALSQHYQFGAPADWQINHVSAYASAHPWEDFAETWAHYLHIIDTLETASAFGLRVHPRTADTASLQAKIDFDPHRNGPWEPVIKAWLPLTFAMNSLARSMGANDLYPFILSSAVIDKLGFIHDLVHGNLADRAPVL
jgi:hypothetical protein